MVLLFRDVELIKPADDLDVLAGVLGHHLAQFGKDGGLRQQILGHQQFGVVVDLLEEEGHRPVPLVAGVDKEEAIGLGLRIRRRGAAIQKRRDALRRAFGQVSRHRFGKHLGPRRPLGRGDDTHGSVAIGIHEAQRSEPVEPGVGCLFDDLPLAILPDRRFQILDRLGIFAPCRAAVGKHDVNFRRHLIDQQVACGLREFLERVGIHQTITFLPAWICSSRVFFISSTYCSTSASSVR